MNTKHFDAIIAKNRIAEDLATHVHYRQEATEFPNDSWLNVENILFQLEEIEKFIGQGNQPSARDAYEYQINSRPQNITIKITRGA